MKVLQFFPSINISDGGTTTYIKELAPALGRMVELHVCALGDKKNCVPLENATVHTIEVSLKHICRMKRQFMAVLDEVKPDVVHINCCWMPQCALVQKWTREWQHKSIIHNPSSLPVLLTPHGMLEPWIISRNYWTKKLPAMWLYQKWAVKNADVIVSTAEEERKHIEALGWNNNIIMVPNGIDTAPIEMKSEWKDAKDLLFMSRIHPKKGLEILIEALVDVRGLNLKIAGDGEADYVQSLKNLVSCKGLTERVTFTGPIYGEEKWRMIRDADVVVLPSYSENFGLIVAEALASGTPVMTTTGTPWKSIEEYGCGWWIDANVDAVKHALNSVESTLSGVLKKMGLRGRALIEEQFSVEKLAKRLLITYGDYRRNET